MKSYESMVEDYGLIKEFCSLYRTELNIVGALMSENYSLTTYDDYMKFINNLSDEEFYANYLICLLNDASMFLIRSLMNGVNSIDDYVKAIFNFDENIYKKYLRKVKKAKAQI